MRWSKLKTLVEARFAKSIAGRVAIFSAAYGNCTCGRAWITVDGQEIANFCTRAYANHHYLNMETKVKVLPFGQAELSRQDAYASCWSFVHDMTNEEALADEDPLVQSLAVLDSRMGKRRIVKVNWMALHPLAQVLLCFRLQCEGLPVNASLMKQVSLKYRHEEKRLPKDLQLGLSLVPEAAAK